MLKLKKDNISIVDSITILLNKGQIYFQTLVDNTDRTIFSYDVDTQQGEVKIIIDLDKVENIFYNFAILPIKIPIHKRSEVCEYLNRINWKSIRGRFILDMEDGELRYICSFWYDLENSTSESILRKNLHQSFNMLDYFMPSILGITYGNAEPKNMITKMYEETDYKSN
jgi:hypothetical protein